MNSTTTRTRTSKYVEPYSLKAKILAWSELNLNEIDLLIFIFKNQSTNGEIYNFLEKVFDLNGQNQKDKIQLDLCFYAIKFAFENSFNKIQISSFVSILRALHKANEETPFENYHFLEKYFNQLIICHSIKRPPFCVQIFDNQTMIKVINYISNTYMKHYKLYKYVFTPIVGMDLNINYINRKNTPSSLQYDEEERDELTEMKNFNQSDNRINNNESSMINNQQTDESSSSSTRNEFKSYIRQLLNEEIENEFLKCKIDNYKSELESEYLNKMTSSTKPDTISKQKSK